MLTHDLPDIEHRTEVTLAARPVILLVAYECGPSDSSEARSAWERVLHAAREFETHVIVGPDSFAAIEGDRNADCIPDTVHIHTPPPDARYRLLERSSLARIFLLYRHWHRLAFRLARELHRKYCFSLVHQVNRTGFHEPGYAWRLGIPFVWGPVGGTENFPPAFLAGLPAEEQIKERARNLGNRLSLRSRRAKQAARKASVLLAANSTAQSDFERAFRRPIELLHATAIDTVRRPETAKFRAGGPLNILWAGEFTTQMALPLLLEAVANLGHDVEYQLHIVGTGLLELEWKELAIELGVARRCSFRGELPPVDTIEQLEWAHLFVYTSLRDTSAPAVLEALGRGVPVMCFDHQGAGDIVTSACGIKIPVTHPGHAIAAMASSIRSLAQERTRLLQLSAGACDRARNYLWFENTMRVASIYRSLALVTPVRSRI